MTIYSQSPGPYSVVVPPQAGSTIPSSYNYGAGGTQYDPDSLSTVDLPGAKYLYHQAYQPGGLNGLGPWDLGHAAAYRAIQVIRDGIPRERESLISLAVAEASNLIRQSGRETDLAATTAASETAARTASRIFDQSQSLYMREGISRPLYGGMDDYMDPANSAQNFEADAGRPFPRMRCRSQPYTHPSTFVDAPPETTPGYYANTYNSQVDPSYGGIARPTTGQRYPPTPFPATTATAAAAPTTTTLTAPIITSTPAPTTIPHITLPRIYQAPQSTTAYQNTQVPMTQGSLARPHSASFTYPTQSSYPPRYIFAPATNPSTSYANTATATMPYANTTTPGMPYVGNSNPGMPYASNTIPGQTIVIHRPSKHRHRHHRRHRSYSR